MDEDYRVCWLADGKRCDHSIPQTLKRVRETLRVCNRAWPWLPHWIECISNPNRKVPVEASE